jgi:hypothetical protein
MEENCPTVCCQAIAVPTQVVIDNSYKISLVHPSMIKSIQPAGSWGNVSWCFGCGRKKDASRSFLKEKTNSLIAPDKVELLICL